MSWQCQAHQVPVIEHWAMCGTCGWSQRCDTQHEAEHEAAAHSRLHDDIYERSDGLDLGEYLGPKGATT